MRDVGRALGWERVGWRGGGDSGKVSGGRAEAA